MTDFKDTSKWEKKNNSSIIYRYDYQGKPHEGTLEKDPHTVRVNVERLSVMDTTAWALADKKVPDSETGFRSYEYIRATGRLDGSRVHAFIIGEAATTTFDRIDISIYPTALEDLQKTSTHERWSLRGSDEKPEDGWLKDEKGRIDFYEANEYMDEPSLSARLWLDQATYATIVQKIKNGSTIRSVQIEVLADLFQFGYEGAFGSPRTTWNYGLLCDNAGRSVRGHTTARLEEMLVEWGPSLTKGQSNVATAGLPPATTDEDNHAPAVNRVAADVGSIRAKLDIFYQVGIAVLVFLIIRDVIDWFRT